MFSWANIRAIDFNPQRDWQIYIKKLKMKLVIVVVIKCRQRENGLLEKKNKISKWVNKSER